MISFLSTIGASRPMKFTIRRARSLCILSLLGGCLLSTAWADPILDKADAFLKSGRADAASAIYQEYVRQNPNAIRPRLMLAELAIRRFDYAQARRILEETLVRHPESPEVASTLGHLFQLWMHSPTGKVADQTRDYQALAQEHFRQAQALGADHPTVLTHLADWAMHQNDLVSAEQHLQRALQVDNLYIPAYQSFVRFYIKTRDLQRAKDVALHAIELDPVNAGSYFLVAQLLGLANQPAEAVKYALRSEQLDYGRLPERDYFLASQLERLGDLPRAVLYYESLRAYTPRDATIPFKLGALYERLNKPEESLTAYRQAMELDPGLLPRMLSEAREQTRTEKIDAALAQWRRLVVMKADDPGLLDEAIGAIAGLHYLRHFYQPDQPSAHVDADYQKLSSLPAADVERRQLDLAKLTWVKQAQMTATVQAQLQQLALSADAAVAGEAAYLMGDFRQAHARLEQVERPSAEAYLQLADRLLLVQELQFASAFYQRAYAELGDPALEAAMKRIQAKHTLARQRVEEGNVLFNLKNYEAALAKYEESRRIYRQGDNVYLRLGDTYEQLKRWPEAKQAYDQAIALMPGLMDSKGFAKNYRRLEKRALKAVKN